METKVYGLLALAAAVIAVGSHYWSPWIGPPDFRTEGGGPRMRAAVYTAPLTDHLKNVLHTRWVDQPYMSEDEVLVKVRFAAINHGDWLKISGVYPPGHCQPSPKSICSLGTEGSGVVERVGRRVTGVTPGQSVFFVTGFGRRRGTKTFAEFVAVNQRGVFPLPEGWSLRDASGVAVAGWTAVYALSSMCNITAGAARPTVLITGGGSATGQMGIAFAKSHGARVVTRCSKRSAARCKQLGADVVVDRENEQDTRKMLADLGSDLIVFETNYDPPLLEMVQPRARCLVAIDPGPSLVSEALRVAWKRITGQHYAFVRPTPWLSLDDFAVFPVALAEGRIPKPEVTTYPFEKVVEAMEFMSSGLGSPKKIVLEFPE